MPKIQSPLRGWLGGKYRLAPTIVSLIPEHTCYAEVFGGAAWVLFHKCDSGSLKNSFRIFSQRSNAYHTARATWVHCNHNAKGREHETRLLRHIDPT